MLSPEGKQIGQGRGRMSGQVIINTGTTCVIVTQVGGQAT